MKEKRWAKVDASEHNAILLVLGGKLCEESAEVMKEVTKAPFRKKGLNKVALLEELEHVDKMTALIRTQLFK